MRVVLPVLLAAAAAGYLVDLGGSSIWDANEAYYVETPREMIERGDYVNPSFNYEPRFNKPVLSYWIVAALYHLFGVSVAVERMAIAAAAFVMIGAVWWLGRAASVHPAAPLLAAVGLAANPRFFMFSRRILIDMALAAAMTLVLLCFALAERYPARRRAWLIAMYVCVGLGVLVKGPVAAVLPAMAFAVYLAVHGELRRVREMMVPAGVAIVLAIVAPWYVAVYAGSGWTHIAGFFVGENLDRYTSLMSPDRRGVLFYLPVVLTDALPWSLWIPAAVAVWWHDWRRRRFEPDTRIRTLLLVWIAVIVGVFSLSQTKQDLYVFPIVGAVMALGGDVVARAFAGAGGRGWLTGTLTVAAVALGVAGLGILVLFGPSDAVYALAGARVAGVLFCAGAVAIALLARRRAVPAVVVLLAVFVAFNWTLVIRVLPSFERYKPAVPLSEAVLRHARDGDVVAHYDVSLPSMVFYLRRPILVASKEDAFLAIMQSERAVLAVLPEHRYEALRPAIGRPTCELARGEIADVKLGGVLARQPPPAVLLVGTRCP